MEDLTKLLKDLVGSDRYLQALIVLLVSLIAARILDWLITNAAKRLAGKTRTEIDDKIIEYSHRPLHGSVILIGLAIATLLLKLPDTPTWVAFALLKTFAVIFWVVFGVRFIKLSLRAMARRSDRVKIVQVRTLPLFENLAITLLVLGASYFVMVSWNIDVTAWVASAGIIGLAVGFAAKDTLANLFAGVFIMADAPYKLGDMINLSSGERGEVTHIGIRSTRLLTRDDVEITIPNAIMGSTQITNESGGRHVKFRVRVKVGVAYGSDIDKVRDVLLIVPRGMAHVCAEPEPRVRFRAFGDSSLDFELMCWIDEPVLRGRVLDALNTTVYKRFAEEDIQIPFPQRDVYIKEQPRPREVVV